MKPNKHRDTLITRPAIPKLEQIEKRSQHSALFSVVCHANADPNLLFMLIKVRVRLSLSLALASANRRARS
jgi:hypothetical protein